MTTRRSFIASGAAAVSAMAASPPRALGTAEYDLVIRGGTLFDGTGTAGVPRDVAIANGRIAAVAARVRGRGADEIDGRGLVVAPGFIDTHSHADGSIADDPRSESVVRQGITTIVVGQDGSSRATGGDDRPFGAMLSATAALTPSVNVASFVGFGSVRGAVVGNDSRKATAAELATMTAMVERALAEGACGGSSGLEYTPGAFADLAELTALARPLAARRLPYATHMRNEDDRLLDAIDESIAVARGAGCPLHISHLKTQGPRNWGKLDDAFARIDRAASNGVDISFDRYPYVAYWTGLTNLFPVWSRDGGTSAFLVRLADTVVAPRIRAETLAKVELIGGWDNVQISAVRAPADSTAPGRRLGAYAASLGSDPYELAVALLQRSEGSVGMVGFAMSEENLDRILAHPRCTVCTDGGGFAVDGPTRRGSPHPRGIGTFPRVLGRYVRERRVMPLAEAIRKMTSLPAARMRLRDRGRVVRGLAADVVVFDPATVADRATFDAPFQYPVGIEAVIVNGRVALRGGERSAAAGQVLRPS